MRHVIYNFNDQVVEPFREIGDQEPRTTGNHGVSKRDEEGADQEAALERALSAARARPGRRRSSTALSRGRLPTRCRGRCAVAAEEELVSGVTP